MFIRVLYLIVPAFLCSVGIVFLTVSGQSTNYMPAVILLAMLATMLSGIAIFGIRFNAGRDRFVVDHDPRKSSRFANIVNNQNELITCFTLEGDFLFANDAYCNFVGKGHFEIVGTSIFDDVPEEEANDVRQEIVQRARTRQSWAFTNSLRKANGQERIIEWSNTASFNENGEIVEIQSVGRDVTDQLRENKNEKMSD